MMVRHAGAARNGADRRGPLAQGQQAGTRAPCTGEDWRGAGV
jgi:hypothetical protein